MRHGIGCGDLSLARVAGPSQAGMRSADLSWQERSIIGADDARWRTMPTGGAPNIRPTALGHAPALPAPLPRPDLRGVPYIVRAAHSRFTCDVNGNIVPSDPDSVVSTSCNWTRQPAKYDWRKGN